MAQAPHYALMAERCDQCLIGKDRIVPGSRAAEIVRQIRRDDCKFICHKAQLAGLENVACRGVHDLVGPCRAFRFAKAFGIEIVEISPRSMGVAA